MHLGAHDPRSAQDRSTVHNLCSPDANTIYLDFLGFSIIVKENLINSRVILKVNGRLIIFHQADLSKHPFQGRQTAELRKAMPSWFKKYKKS